MLLMLQQYTTSLSKPRSNLRCIDFDLPQTVMGELDAISKIPFGFPMDFIQSKGVQEIIYGSFDVR
jgi:hypothetical protein